MRWTLLIAVAAIAATLWLPGEAAQPAAPGGGDKITFEDYREWRDNFLERRRSELAVALSAGDLSAQHKARLEQTKAYYDWLAGLSAADRDRRYRDRFERIDSDHDGTMDRAERAAWRDKQRAFYHRDGTAESAARPAAGSAAGPAAGPAHGPASAAAAPPPID
ncbi:MAG TPA: hypothetical protein VKQ73_07385 [Stellaceae bacterium]|nr:hypothetical protein [Stellaceae bacterium]